MTCGGLAIQAVEYAVILRAQFDPGDVFHADDSAIRSFTDDNVFKLLRRCQAALSENGIGELLARRELARRQLDQPDLPCSALGAR